ncbi:P-loop containing nucleoside triphosphate hydrolase protein [Infundibulicybe gibba]|nr:P-loop containing nucleoside triphosphate hydrolase protein [Infundibulicybe gibba]
MDEEQSNQPKHANPLDPSPSSSLRRTRWGIFEVAYESHRQYRLPLPTLGAMKRAMVLSAHGIHLLRELYTLAPFVLTAYTLGFIWMSISPAFSLYISYSILVLIEQFISGQLTPSGHHQLQLLANLWICSLISSFAISRMLEENKFLLIGHLRTHFLPRLAEVSLRLDSTRWGGHQYDGVFPDAWSFGHGAPGWDFVNELFTRLRNFATFFLEVFVLIYIITQIRNPDAQLLTVLGVAFLLIMLFAPSNGVGGAGYTFWTHNSDFHRLHALYTMIFDEKYRRTVARDGTSESLCQEYKRASDSLGVVRTDTFSLAGHLPVPWYWGLARGLIVDYPAALYILMLNWSLSSSSLRIIALLQLSMSTLKTSVDCLRGGQDPASFVDILRKAEKLYAALAFTPPEKYQGMIRYPVPGIVPVAGMKLSFRDVSFRYTDTPTAAVDQVSFDIEPGQLVVIVGANGSGKTSLLNLLHRLSEPTSGEILIDDIPLPHFDLGSLRGSMAFLTQTEEIYPISLRENLTMGAVDPAARIPSRECDAMVDNAARMGGSYDLIQRLGYGCVLDPLQTVGQSMTGTIGSNAHKEMCRHTNGKGISISHGEKQRLVASRTFMRLMSPKIKLLVVDEPTSALDPISEREVFNHFRAAQKGRTSIFVTHRFGNLVKHADIILCMDNGRIVQRGTHQQLIREPAGKYYELYTSQIDGFK